MAYDLLQSWLWYILHHQMKLEMSSSLSPSVFPVLWLFGALTLITPRGSLTRIFMPYFQDFAPSTDALCDDNMQTEAEKEAYLERVHIAEIRWAKRCLLAFCILLSFAIAVAVTVIATTKAH